MSFGADDFAEVLGWPRRLPEPPVCVALRIPGLDTLPGNKEISRQAFRFRMFAAHPDLNPEAPNKPVRQFAVVRRQFASELGVCEFASSPSTYIWRTGDGEHTTSHLAGYQSSQLAKTDRTKKPARIRGPPDPSSRSHSTPGERIYQGRGHLIPPFCTSLPSPRKKGAPMHDQFGGVGDLRRAHQLLAAYATQDVAAMNAVWREATAQMATVDLAAALVAATFDVAPELRDRVSEFRAAATEFAALEAEVAADG